jgi:hypothetical protein
MIRRPYLRYLQGQQLFAAQREPRFRVRVFHPKGRYPRSRIAQPEALFWADDDIVFCVTLSMRWSPVEEDAPYSEMDWLNLDELRFIGSILLCELWDEPALIFYPVHYYSPVINRRKLDLTKESTAISIRNLVIQGIRGPAAAHYAPALHECVTHRYSFAEDDFVDLSRQPTIWQNLPTSNHLLLRGLNALLKSDMLSRYSEFFEEATISCFIALEASFRLILKRLVAEGVKDPNAKDAAAWLHEHFDRHLGFEAPLERYFQEFYDQRVMTLHPASRFGEYPYAPLMHDDYYHLRGSLRSIFAYLITGAHDKGFLDAVNKQRGS